jgi:hypothetical protein
MMNRTRTGEGEGGRQEGNCQEITVSTAYAYAALLRWLTPLPSPTSPGASGDSSSTKENRGVYTGWLNGFDRKEVAVLAAKEGRTGGIEYADGLKYDLDQGWYEFKCDCAVDGKSIAEHLCCEGSSHPPQPPNVYVPAIAAYLTAPSGGDLGSVVDESAFSTLVQAVATLYARMVAGDDMMRILQGLKSNSFSAGTSEYTL